MAVGVSWFHTPEGDASGEVREVGLLLPGVGGNAACTGLH